MRSEGDKLLEAVAEVIEVGERARIPVIVSHLKASGKHNFGKVNGALRMIAEARARGVDVLADTQPYGELDRPYAAEHMMLRSCIPPWVICEAGSSASLRKRLKDVEFRKRLRHDIEERISPDWRSRVMDCILKAVQWENLVLGNTTLKKYKKFVGKSIAEIAKTLRKDPYDAYFDLLAEETVPSGALYFMLDPDDVRTVIKNPLTIMEVDATPRSRHPRMFGCFPRYLAQYVFEERLLSLEDAIRKITSYPASVIGLAKRGLIKEGYYADLVMFDAVHIEDRTSFDNVDRFPKGIKHVFVNGVSVIRNGVHLGTRPGAVLRRGQ
jgi:N-acyl-D-amino-acid deacylase